MSKVIKTGLHNYYGEVEFYQGTDGKFYMALENYHLVNEKEISEEFYIMAVKEFSDDSN